MYPFIQELENIISDRFKNRNEKSYTSMLFNQGIDRILKKVGEEAGEVIIAAKNNDKEELKNESADLLFHLLLALKEQGLTLSDVEAVLKERHGKKVN